MRYYVAKGPIENAGYTWDLSLYKVDVHMSAEAIRFYSDGTIVKDIIKHFSFYFISKHCKQISKEEYESMLEI